MNSRWSRKAIMGIGMLIIFISTILVAAVAAGVLIRTSGLLQERAFTIEKSVRERVINGVDIMSATIHGNETLNTAVGIELMTRLGPGSSQISMSDLLLSTQTTTGTITAEFSDISNCAVSVLTNQSTFCIETVSGDGDNTLEDRELLTLHWAVNLTPSLGSVVTISTISKSGAVQDVSFKAPADIASSVQKIFP